MTTAGSVPPCAPSSPATTERPCLRIARAAVRAASFATNAVLFAVMFLMMMVGLYALWDAHAVYERADASKWEAYIPDKEDRGTYDELVASNPDVLGWLSVYGTNIDYPLVQSDNREYLTRDAEGAYSPTGSLFLEEANADDFGDFSTIVYGHHMDRNAMFGEIGNFADADYFAEHEYGALFVGRGAHANTWYGLHFVAFLSVDAYDASVYRPKVIGPDEQRTYIQHLLEAAVNKRDVAIDGAAGERIVLLSTCSSEGVNARSILVGKIEEEVRENTFAHESDSVTGIGIDAPEGWLRFPWLGWMALAALLAFASALILMGIARRSARGRARRGRAFADGRLHDAWDARV